MNSMSKTDDMQPAQSLPPDVKEKAIRQLRIAIVAYLFCCLVFIVIACAFIVLSKDLLLVSIFMGVLPCVLFGVMMRAELVRIACLRENRFTWKESVVGMGMFEGRQRRSYNMKSYYKAPSIGGKQASGIGLAMLREGDEVYDIEIFAALPLQISSRFQMRK